MSTVEEGEDPSLSTSGVILTEAPSEKEKGIEVPPLPKFNIYVGMQLIAFIALCLASFLMYRELATYNFEKDVPYGTVKDVPVEPTPIPTGRGKQANPDE